jgi:hypothetical protein
MFYYRVDMGIGIVLSVVPNVDISPRARLRFLAEFPGDV